ncbi:MAG: hypothetical protein LBS18_06005 [Clostridiales bacterium]|nr:hypothetical protein [Clostridiales bacterium]
MLLSIAMLLACFAGFTQMANALTCEKTSVATATEIEADTGTGAKTESPACTYTINLPENNEKYEIATEDGPKVAPHGGSFTFSLTLLDGYRHNKPIVEGNDTVLKGIQKGDTWVYKIGGITCDIVISVNDESWTAPKPVAHTVLLPQGEGFMVEDICGGKLVADEKYEVQHGKSISFKVRLYDGYLAEDLVVAANGKTVTPNGNLYVMENITEDTNVTFKLTKRQRHTVTFCESDAASVANVKGGVLLHDKAYGVNRGESLSFEVYVKSSHENRYLRIEANGKTISPKNGVYTLANIKEDVIVTLTLDEAPNRFSLTNTDTKVRVSGYAKATPKLHVSLLANSADAYKTLEKRIEDLKVLGAYDVSLSGSKHEGDVTVTFPVNEAYNGCRVRILRLTGSGKVKTYTAKVKNGKATITADALGQFVVAGVADPGVILPPRTGDNGKGYSLLGCVMVLLAEIGILAVIRHRRYVEEQQAL